MGKISGDFPTSGSYNIEVDLLKGLILSVANTQAGAGIMAMLWLSIYYFVFPEVVRKKVPVSIYLTAGIAISVCITFGSLRHD